MNLKTWDVQPGWYISISDQSMQKIHIKFLRDELLDPARLKEENIYI